MYAVPGIVINTTTDNRNAAYAHGKRIYIPAGVTIRVNLLPDDDVRKFVGEGKLIVKNQWYNTDLTFDVKQSTHGNGISAKDYIVGGIKRQTHTSIGIVGDSISDGAWGKQNWTSPPLDGNRDMLAPQAYNHGLSGGSHAWCAHWQWLMNMVQSRYSADAIYQVFNVSLSGAKLSDGWGYRNFDRGFFGNSTYGSKAPQVCILAMGWNDSGTNLDTYRDQIDMFVRKAWGYGCAVGIITMHDNDPDRIGFEATTKRQMASKLGIDYFDMGDEITRMSNENATSHSLYYMKKEPQYDTTHPQELGQMVMGNSIFMQTLGEKFVMRVRPGDQMNAGTVERWWDAVTYPSSKHLTPSYGRASGSAKLDLFGYLPMGNTAGENVSLNTFIYCEEEGMSLTLLEPWTGNSVVGSNNHMTVQCPAGIGLNEADTTYAARNIKINSYRMLAKGQVASKYIGGSATLTTYAGRLRKGLNQITYVNGANAPNIWYPSLKFGSVYTDGIRLKPTRLSVEQTPVPRMFVPADDKFTDKVITNVMSGRAYSQVPNGFVAQGSLVGQIRCRTGLTAGTYVACNLDTVMSTAILIGIAADGKLGVGTWNRAVPTDWTYFGTALANKPFTIWVYTSTTTGEYQFSVVTDDGTVNQSVKATLVATGGGIGVYNTNSASQTVELEANFDIVREV
ncbi:MAG: hypothetical protein RSF86_13570 [Angelakisella sp.]